MYENGETVVARSGGKGEGGMVVVEEEEGEEEGLV